ncbi:MAG: molybdenum cofactor synthesis domain-containing protein [Myxococcota bacterium]
MDGLSICVITVSDTRTADNDTSGRLIADTLAQAGHRVEGPTIVRDEIEQIRAATAERIPRADAIVVSGGTGITARDVTPEAIQPLITKNIPGFGELFRMLSYQEIGASTIQSRAEAALCGRALVFLLPGSTRAVRLALEKILVPQLDLRTKPCNFAELLPRIRGDIA